MMRGARVRASITGASLAFPAALLVLVLMIAPFLMLARDSFNHFDPVAAMQSAVTLENYTAFFSDPYYRGILATTLEVAGVSTVLALLLGLPTAYLIARGSERLKRICVVLLVLPLLIGSVVRGAGWMILLGHAGILNWLLLKAGWIEQPLQLLYTRQAVIVATLAAVLPYVILSLQSVLEGVDLSIEEAAQNLGANSWTRFFRIVSPLAAPGVAAAAMLVFILCMNSYATPVLLGGNAAAMMAPAVYDQFSRASDWPFGSAMAVILMLVTLAVALAANRLIHARYVKTMLS